MAVHTVLRAIDVLLTCLPYNMAFLLVWSTAKGSCRMCDLLSLPVPFRSSRVGKSLRIWRKRSWNVSISFRSPRVKVPVCIEHIRHGHRDNSVKIYRMRMLVDDSTQIREPTCVDHFADICMWQCTVERYRESQFLCWRGHCHTIQLCTFADRRRVPQGSDKFSRFCESI